MPCRTKLRWVAGLAGVVLFGDGALNAVRVIKPAPQSTVCRVPDRSEVHIAGGTFRMGSADYYEEEGPVHMQTVAPFWIDGYDVTNAEFARFVAATHYVTDAEKRPDPADYPKVAKDKLVAGGAVFISPNGGVRGVEDPTQWWSFVPGADWRHPDGPDSTIAGHDHDPVVQVSYNDALAYAEWKGRELPTEAQYVFAARGGLDGKTYGWGDELTPGGKYQANVWQRMFPTSNTSADGYSGRAPAGCFPANGYGLYDTIGNVRKWTSSLYATSSTKDEMLEMPMSKTPASRVLRTLKTARSCARPTIAGVIAPPPANRRRPASARPIWDSGRSATGRDQRCT